MLDVRLVSEVADPEVLALPLAPAQPPDVDDAATPDTDPGSGSSGAELVPTPYALPPDLRDAVTAFLGQVTATGKAGSLHTLPLPGQRPGTVLLVGVGEGTAADLRVAGAAAARAAEDEETLTVAAPADTTPGAVGALVEGALLASYQFSLASEPKELELRQVTVVVAEPAAHRAAIERAGILAEATCLARDLVNTPGGTGSPQWLAERAIAAATPHGVTGTVWEPERIAAEGFGGLLAVGGGSARGPRFVELRWEPPPDGVDRPAVPARHVVLVGKGITFDTGGISIKPFAAMHLMKKDMGGAAAVLGAVVAAARLRLPVRVTALVPAAENMPSGSAYRPGDVVRHRGGVTSEIRNTDAEGRVVLADALAYAAEQLAPDVLVDLATLTGASHVALGKRTAALFSDDDALAGALAEAAGAAGEKVWRLPLTEDYVEHLDSDVADIANVATGKAAGEAGAGLAALYLRHFAGAAAGRWAHLDMSGPAWVESASAELTKGATGWGVRTLVCWLEGVAGAAATRDAAPRT